MIWDTEVAELCGDDHLESARLRNKKTGEESKLILDGIFIAVGTVPNTQQVKGLVEMDEGGNILADENGYTSVHGVFAAGDLRRKQLRQIITAAADGANAITSVTNYLNTLS